MVKWPFVTCFSIRRIEGGAEARTARERYFIALFLAHTHYVFRISVAALYLDTTTKKPRIVEQ